MTPHPPAFSPLAERAPRTKSTQETAEAPLWRDAPAPLVVVASLAAVVLERIAAVAGDLHLHADGVWFLVKIASTRACYFWILDWRTQFYKSRAFTILIEQLPTVVATHLPVHSLHTLSLVFGATLYLHALLALYLCYHYAPQRWYVLFPLLSLYAGSMNAEAVPANDSHLVVSLFWPVLFILLFRRELRGTTFALLLALSIPMVLSYESMLFFGAILAAVCLWRWRHFSERGRLEAGLAVWYLLCSIVALAAVLWPFDDGNRSGFTRGLIVLLNSDHLAAKVSILVIFCSAVLLVLPDRTKYLQTAVAAVGLIGILFLGSQVLAGHAPATLDTQMPARVLNLLVPLAATALLFGVLLGLIRPQARAVALTAVLIGALGFGQAIWNLGCLMRWQGMLATLRYEMILHDGPVASENSVMAHSQVGPLRLKYLGTGWSLLPLSLYENGRGQVRTVVIGQTNGFVPFDPFAPSTFPDLSRYGILYDYYRDALRRNWRYTLGETLTFARGGSVVQFMHDGWWPAEDWATWSRGQDASLKLPLETSGLPDDLVLEASVVPLLSPSDPTTAAEVFVNGVNVGTWLFRYRPKFEIRKMQLHVPRDVFLRSSPATIRFHMTEPLKSPGEIGLGPDPRKLGLAFISVQLKTEE